MEQTKLSSIYKIAVCDDEPLALKSISQIVQQQLPADTCQLSQFQTAAALTAAAGSFDIALLDIRLAGADNGISLAHTLIEQNPHCQILFISNYLEYAPDVYSVPHISFVYKPQLASRLPVYLKQAVEKLEKQRSSQLTIKIGTTFFRIAPWEILYLERRLRTTTVFLSGQSFETSEKLSEIFKRLPQNQFCFCHRCYVVNLAAVRTCSHSQLILNDGSLIPIGRSHTAEVKQQFLTWVDWIEYLAPGDLQQPKLP